MSPPLFISSLRCKLVYYLHILTPLRTCVKSQSKVDTFFLTFYGRILNEKNSGTVYLIRHSNNRRRL